ncbi:hypothetical protein HYU13_04825 [Candidatus Woesearchaeota archaeon]|nr:hypothetical protein [Candidatus Woesearchaeota archaeon]
MIELIQNLVQGHFFLLFILLLLSSLPLYLALKLSGGNVSILKVFFIGIALSLITLASAKFIGLFGALIVLLISPAAYYLAFKVDKIRAVLAWLFQYGFLALVILALGLMQVI